MNILTINTFLQSSVLARTAAVVVRIDTLGRGLWASKRRQVSPRLISINIPFPRHLLACKKRVRDIIKQARKPALRKWQVENRKRSSRKRVGKPAQRVESYFCLIPTHLPCDASKRRYNGGNMHGKTGHEIKDNKHRLLCSFMLEVQDVALLNAGPITLGLNATRSHENNG